MHRCSSTSTPCSWYPRVHTNEKQLGRCRLNVLQPVERVTLRIIRQPVAEGIWIVSSVGQTYITWSRRWMRVVMVTVIDTILNNILRSSSVLSVDYLLADNSFKTLATTLSLYTTFSAPTPSCYLPWHHSDLQCGLKALRSWQSEHPSHESERLDLNLIAIVQVGNWTIHQSTWWCLSPHNPSSKGVINCIIDLIGDQPILCQCATQMRKLVSDTSLYCDPDWLNQQPVLTLGHSLRHYSLS